MDKETQKIYHEGESMNDYISSKGWRKVKEIFTNKITDLQSIKNLDTSTPAKMMADMKARMAAVDILIEIIKEVEGMAEQHEMNKALLVDSVKIIE